MKHSDIAKQMVVENSLMKYLIEGMRHMLAWKTDGPEFARKLSTFRFIAGSFQRHLERLLNLEERDGYMKIVLEEKPNPNMAEAVAALKQEHGEFRKAIERILERLEKVTPSDHATLSSIEGDVNRLLDQFQAHTTKEADLMQEAFERDDGGEG